MTPLRQQMIRTMSLAGLSEATQKNYIGLVRRFLNHVRTIPEQVTEEQLAGYFLFCQKSPHGTFVTRRAALCLLFRDTLQRPWPLFQKKCAAPSSFASPRPCRTSRSAA